MPEQLLSVTRRTPFLVNRVEETEIVCNAIYDPSRKCRVIFLYGDGGMGKSRLVEEVLWRAGNSTLRDEAEGRGPVPDDHPEWDWTQYGNSFVGNIIDLTDTALHTRTNLMDAIRNAFVRAVPIKQLTAGKIIDFSRYDAAHGELERKQQFQGDFQYIAELRSKTEELFFNDYAKNAKERRLVMVFDTAEKLFTFGPSWLREKNLLHDEDLSFSALFWLAEQLKTARFDNTTLVFVGRKTEGAFFFGKLRSAVQMLPETSQLDELELLPFKFSETGKYIEAWIDAYAENPDLRNAVETLKAIQTKPERLEVLHLYTGGQPVRLALYIDLIVEGITIPDPLNDTLAQARQRCNTDNPENPTPELEQARREIESEFIKLLFVRPTLRAQILKALVRAPRGLDGEQLHYILDSQRDQSPENWLDAEEHGFKEIEQELEMLKRLSIVKMRPDGRFGLQDEIYRIYAQHMLERQADKLDETQARHELYKKLADWAEYQRKSYISKRNEFQNEDLQSLRFYNPAEALSIRFPIISEHEQARRTAIRRSIQAWELENVHYALLVDPVQNLNSTVFDLADKRWVANDEDADVIAQGELWQVFNDPHLLEFVKMKTWPGLEARKESPESALRRLTEQLDATGWIKRFINRRDYDRALVFYQALEKEVDNFLEPERGFWRHTFAQGEPRVWACFAHIMKSAHASEAIAELDQIIEDLEQLLAFDQFELAFPERNEKGFRGHPAEKRLIHVLAIAHNFAGYGHKAALGKNRSGVWHYGRALKYLRDIPFRPLQATIRNNLSAALTVRGYARARRLCLDGLILRKKDGAEVPLGYSYNTLALIDNDNQRPDLAWVEAATALAYFNLADDPRGQGLTLLQLGEALRRMARLSGSIGYVIPSRPEALYSEAKKAADQAIDIFTNSPAKGEKSRLVEAYIEKGCLERDLVLFNREYEEKPHKQVHYQESLYYLGLAIKLASELSNLPLHLDAQGNVAWVHYYAGNYDAADDSLVQAEKLLPDDCLITEQGPLPLPGRDDFYVYQQLSKMYGVRGHIAMRRFLNRQNELYNDNPDLERSELHKKIGEDEGVKKYLKQAAEHFILALAYSQLLSPRSNALTIIYNVLYEYLKRFNAVEMNLFTQFEQEARQKYRTSELKLDDLGNPDDFLRDCFGVEIEGA